MNYTEQQLTAAIVSEGLRPVLAGSESGAPTNFLMLIQKCWAQNSLDRPSFDDIVEELKSITMYDNRTEWVDKNPGIAPPSEQCQHGVSHIKSYQENINWFTQGEQWSKTTHVANSKFAMWSNLLSNHHVYTPKLAWGSFATCGRRETMEDTHFMLPQMCDEKDIHMFGIFDGHRGAAAAEFAARALPGFLQTLGSTNSPSDALAQAFVKTDIAFRNELTFQLTSRRVTHKDWHPGCTVITALLVRDKLFVANAGDCRTILCRNGHPIPLSRDHVASCPDERARVMKHGMEVKWQVDTWRIGPAALQVTRSIGDDDLKPAVTAEPEITEISLSVHDEYLVMASDGLWDVLSNEDVVSIIRDTVKEPGMCSKRLATEAAARGSKDNITVIVVFLRPVSTAERVY
uniref:protein-serine/threonine phosphatase n=2 Tax=Anthurium amnicola TaxID=1678845 RepID=A0A1D1Z8M4_9ARAE